jgi:hypothetical protein
MATAQSGAKTTAAIGGRRVEAVRAFRHARHIGSLSMRPDAEMLRWHDEQRNVVMVVIPRRRSVHHEGPLERGQGSFKGRTAIRADLAFPFRNPSEYSPPRGRQDASATPVAASA